MLETMNGIGSASSSALSGLTAASTQLAVSANNVANLNTNGFAPASTSLSDDSLGGVHVTISDAARALASAPSGTDYVRESLVQTTAAFSFQANLKTLETSQSMDATLMALGLPDSSR